MSDRIITSGSIVHGSKGSIGATALQLTTDPTPLRRGVTVKAALGNSTNKVYVGLAGVTADNTAATDGFELLGGDSVTIEIDAASKLYVIGSTTGLKVFFVGN